MEFRLRNRTRLRRKEASDLAARLSQNLGTATMFTEDEPVETAEGGEANFFLIGNELVGLWDERDPFLLPRGLLKYPPTKRFVTVDMGAVKFVTNGADVMGPGITDADPDIKAGDWVWVREVRHGKPLAVGRALADAGTLRSKAKGKQVKTFFFVGDKVWTWGQQEETEPTSEGDAAS